MNLKRSSSNPPPAVFELDPPSNTRIPALDGLRGLASLMVLVYHFGPHIVRDDNSLFAVLHRIPPFWFQGVDLFFVLSGFLISRILIAVRKSPNYYYTFYVRRLFRICPLYYVVFSAYALAFALGYANTEQRLFENPLPLWTYALYVQNVSMAIANSFGAIWMAATWSLAVEEQFYLTLPWVIHTVTDRGLILCAFAALAGSVLLRALVQKYDLISGVAGYVLLPMRLDSLAVGVIVTLIVGHQSLWLSLHRRLIGIATIVMCGLWTIYPYIPNPHAIRLSFIDHTMSALAFGSLLLSLLLYPDGACSRLLSTKCMRTVGNMAYSTYLFHPIMLCVAFRMMRGKDPSLSGVADLAPLVLACISTLCMSWIAWSCIESRLIRYGHAFRY